MRQFETITRVLAKSLNVSVDDFTAGFKPAIELDFLDVVNFWESNLGSQRHWSLESICDGGTVFLKRVVLQIPITNYG